MVRALFVGVGVLVAAVGLGGCGVNYNAPGRAADMSLFRGPMTARDSLTDPSVREVLMKEPLASFPAGLAVARVQASGYGNYCVRSYGSGAYSVVTTRDVETDKDFERLQKLPMVRSVSPISRLLLPGNLQSGEDVRQAGAAAGADILLLYTFDTEFKSDDLAPPIAIVTLGLFPTNSIKVNSTVSAVLLDVRNGYVYGSAEASSSKSSISNAWTDNAAVDGARKRAEREALDGLINNLEKTWCQVVAAQVPRGVMTREEWTGYGPMDPATGEWRWIQGYPPVRERVPEGQRYRTGP